MKKPQKPSHRYALKFIAEVQGGRLFPERVRNEATEREIARLFKDGDLVRVVVFKRGPNLGAVAS